MKKTITAGLFLLCSALCFGQSKQLSKWINFPNEIDFRKSSPTSGSLNGAPASMTGTYNCWYEDGKLLFYVLPNGYVYRANHTSIGRIAQNLYGEISIFPHTDNFTNLCSKKYWLMAYGKNAASAGYFFVTGIDMAPASTTPFISNAWRTLNMNENPMAISKLNATGNRFVYASYPTSSGPRLGMFNFNAAFSIYSTPAPLPAIQFTGPRVTGEMELSDNGHRLAYINYNTGNVEVLTLNPATGLPTGAPLILYGSSSIKGLEFDETGNKLFFSGMYTSGLAVYEYNFSTSTASPIAGSSNYAGGMLEKSFSSSSITSKIICANTATSQLGRINSSSSSISTIDLSWNLGVGNTIMPDQVDGEDLDDDRISVKPLLTYKAYCNPHTFTVNFNVHPYILQYYSSLFYVQIEKNLGSTYPWTFYSNPAITQNSEALSITQTTNFSVNLYTAGSAGTCPVRKTFSLYILPCKTIGTFSEDPHTPPPNFGRVISHPDFGPEETIMAGFANAWALQELDEETHMPLYTIDDACWHTEPGMDNTFKGFDPQNHNYIDESLVCGAEDGIFQLGHTYRVLRTVWADGMDPVVYDDIFTVYDDSLKSAPFSIATGSQVYTDDETRVYPNPSSGMLTIQTNLSQNGIILVYDVMGHKVRELGIGTNRLTTTLDLTSLPKGIYTLKITSGKKITARKIVLQ